MRGKKLYWIAGVLIVGLLGAVLGKKKFNKESVEVTVESVEVRDIIEMVSANGKIQPEKEVKISPEVPGEIIKLNIQEGGVVQQGQLLVEINPDILTASVDRMEAALNSSKANLSNAKARLAQNKARLKQVELAYSRSDKLKKDGAISQSELDQALANYQVAQAEVEAAEESVKASEFSVKSSNASLKEAKDNLSRTRIFAPISGTVYGLNVEQGEKVVGTAQMAGTEMLRIANLNNMEVNVEVSESDIVRVSIGDSAYVEVDAYLDRKFDGIVTEISNSANNGLGSTEQVTTFDVRIRLLASSYQDLMSGRDSTYSPFRPGMSAAVEIKTQKVEQAVSVPIQSVTLRPDSLPKGKPLTSVDRDDMNECIFLMVDGKAQRVMVKTGVQDENYIEVLSPDITGKVITGPYATVARKLRDGDEVLETDDIKSEED
jgi:HlyD family secretion protein